MTALSVVIPTFNRQKTLASTIQSCLAFSASLDVEFIIVDDGSSDGTASYLESLSQAHDHIDCMSIRNTGPGNARNIGAEAAKGDVILFLGDDTRPVSDEFFKTHLRLHERFPEETIGILGKVVWPREAGYDVTYVMSLVQGDGQQQFGFANMRPYARYDWRFFYTANVSLKRSCVSDWSKDGFSSDFRCAAFEDGEFAYRLSRRLGSFEILYAPTAIAEHDHPYSAEGFIGRQFAAGMMANVLIEKHPDTAVSIRLPDLISALNQPLDPELENDQPDYLAVIEGIFASARLLDRGGHAGASAWHASFLNAVFELAFLKGVIWTYPDAGANRGAGYRYALDRFDARMGRSLELENLASVAALSNVRQRTTKVLQGSNTPVAEENLKPARSAPARRGALHRLYGRLRP